MDKSKKPAGSKPSSSSQPDRSKEEAAVSLKGCIHCPENHDFYKYQNLPPFYKLSCKTSAGKVRTELGRCELCAAYGWQIYWRILVRNVAREYGRQEALSPNDLHRDQSFEASSFEWETLESGSNKKGLWNFDLDANQFGETFHIVTSAILSPSEIRINLEKSNEDQKELMHYYFNSSTAAGVLKPDGTLTKGSKADATNVISRIFEANSAPGPQAKLFQYIRDFMDMSRFVKEPPHNKYACPSYSGKYWLNRFLQATQNTKLPKAGAVDRIAVINIRKTPAASSAPAKTLQPRMEMTTENLVSTIYAIIAANCIARLDSPPGNQFSHIILYGDLSPTDAGIIIKTVQEHLAKNFKKPSVMNIEILYITSPWRILKLATGPMKEAHQFANATWANFRGDKGSLFGGGNGGNIDGVPQQVKIMGIYLALQQRYGNKLCFIGARSGFLEAAAFLGSPVFYYNETNAADFGAKQSYDDGTVLWNGQRTRELYEDDRMGRAGNALNTVICVDLTSAKDEAKGVTVGGQGRRQLVAALYMFMLAHGPEGQQGPLWECRVTMRSESDGDGNFLKSRWNRCVLVWDAHSQGNKENVSKDVVDICKIERKS